MALFSLSDLIATINGRRAMSTKVENTEDSPVPVQLTGSNVELIKEWLNIPVPAGSLVAYDSNDVSSFSKIIPCFREINAIAHSNSFGLNWRAYGSTPNSIGETILDTGTRMGGGSLIEVKGKAVQLVIRNLDTVSRTYNIFLLGRRL